jgi:hypothetical protein
LRAHGLEIILEACHHHAQRSAKTKGFFKGIVPCVKSFSFGCHHELMFMDNQGSVLALTIL